MESSESQMKLLLAKGKTNMEEELYADSLSSIVKAINMCPCSPASHGKDKSCNISQCIAAVRGSDSDPDSLYRVAIGPCSCGFKWPSCTRPLHLEAVDTLAACLEKAKRYTAAFSTALGLIRLDPASAIGYCRVAKIIRYLVRDDKAPDKDVTRSLAALLRDAKLSDIKRLHQCLTLLVKCGLHNTEEYRHSPDDKYHAILRQMAHNLKLPQSRRDPFTKLPRELIGIIFSHLDTTALIRCCRVNKTWRRIIETDTLLWSSISLKKPTSSRYFGKFLQRHRTMRSLLIDDFSRLKLSPEKLALILRLPHLKRLRIAGAGELVTANGGRLSNIKANEIAPLVRLSLLRVLDSRRQVDPVWMQIVSRTASSLEVLELGHVIVNNLGPNSPVFPNLKKLYLCSRGHVSIPSIAHSAPNLEYLFADSCGVYHDGSLSMLKSLRSLSIGQRCYLVPQPSLSPGPPGFPRKLEVIELMSVDERLSQSILSILSTSPYIFSGNDDSSDEPEAGLQLQSLKVFRCKSTLPADGFKQLLEPALQNGSLRVLELAMPFAHYHQGILTEPAKDYPSASSDHVHTVGLYRFSWPDTYSDELSAGPFLDWLKRFPNVETVTAYPVKTHESALSLFSRLICHPGIKVIHQERLQGVEWDQAQELAKKRGVKLLHTPNHTPIGWPLND